MSKGQRNLLLGGIAVAAIAVAILLFARGRGSSALPKEYTIWGVCLACQEEAETTQPLADYAPFECPHCSQHAVYNWFYCYDCKKRFVPDLGRPDPGGPLRLPTGLRCRACRSDYVGQYDPQLPTQDPVGTAPLPDWGE